MYYKARLRRATIPFIDSHKPTVLHPFSASFELNFRCPGLEMGATSFDVVRGVSVVVIVTFSLKYLGLVFERKKVVEDLYPALCLPSILSTLSSELVSYRNCVCEISI